MTRFHVLTVKDIHRETRDSVSISLAIPDALKKQFAFLPGQYLTLRQNIDGEDIRRSYSICSGLDDGDLRIGIKKVSGGAFSTFGNDNLKVGDQIDVMPPQGRFTPRIEVTTRNVLCIAAGSGITPVLSIIKSLLGREPETRVTLVYGNQTSQSVMFAEEIEDLKNRYLCRFSVIHILSREAQDVALLAGRITTEKLAALAKGVIDFHSMTEAFLCGPEAMVKEAASALPTLGVASESIRFELFSTALPRKRHAAVFKDGKVPAVLSRITVALDGKRHAFDVLVTDESLIDAATRNGLELPYSCKGGMCCTCRCKVEAGEATMAVNYSLEEWELKAGFILACQAVATTPSLTLDFDQL